MVNNSTSKEFCDRLEDIHDALVNLTLDIREQLDIFCNDDETPEFNDLYDLWRLCCEAQHYI